MENLEKTRETMLIEFGCNKKDNLKKVYIVNDGEEFSMSFDQPDHYESVVETYYVPYIYGNNTTFLKCKLGDTDNTSCQLLDGLIDVSENDTINSIIYGMLEDCQNCSIDVNGCAVVRKLYELIEMFLAVGIYVEDAIKLFYFLEESKDSFLSHIGFIDMDI